MLVHGAGTGGWVWRRVRGPLARAGHEVFTPTLTGLGERAHLARRDIGLGTHVDDIVGVLECEELSDVVLVGSGYAGLVITAVADRLPGRVRRLVYLDGIVVDDGQAVLDITPAETRETWQRLVLAGDGWRVPPMQWSSFGHIDADGGDAAEIRRLLLRSVPTPLGLLQRAADASPRRRAAAVDLRAVRRQARRRDLRRGGDAAARARLRRAHASDGTLLHADDAVRDHGAARRDR